MAGLRIAIDARITPNSPCGLLQVVLGLAHGFSQLSDGREQYLFLVPAHYDGWLKPYLGSNSQTIRAKTNSKRGFVQKCLNTIWPDVPNSDGTLEDADVDGVHFLLPMGFRTTLPCTYQIHDLQHLHYPHYFRRSTLRIRKGVIPALCEQATRIFTMTQWGQQDVIEKLGIPRNRIAVVPWGSVLSVYELPTAVDADEIICTHCLQKPFAFFPAKAYPHKNHVRLVQAIARIRDEYRLRIPLVLCGATGQATKHIEEEIRRSNLEGQVRHLGFVDPKVMAILYRQCRCLVFPSLFEGWGLPITEAFSVPKAVVCARSTCLPEIAGDAAEYFDPWDVNSIADALVRVWEDATARSELKQRARKRQAQLTWENSARNLRSHFRQLFEVRPKRQRRVA